MRANMGLHERAVMGLASQAVSAQVTKHFVTFFSKTCHKAIYTQTDNPVRSAVHCGAW